MRYAIFHLRRRTRIRQNPFRLNTLAFLPISLYDQSRKGPFESSDPHLYSRKLTRRFGCSQSKKCLMGGHFPPLNGHTVGDARQTTSAIPLPGKFAAYSVFPTDCQDGHERVLDTIPRRGLRDPGSRTRALTSRLVANEMRVARENDSRSASHAIPERFTMLFGNLIVAPKEPKSRDLGRHETYWTISRMNHDVGLGGRPHEKSNFEGILWPEDGEIFRVAQITGAERTRR